jgi:hypothetical protein
VMTLGLCFAALRPLCLLHGSMAMCQDWVLLCVPSRNLKEAMWDAAQLLDRTFTPRDIFFREFTPGTTIAAAARITVTTADGAVRSDMQYSQDLCELAGGGADLRYMQRCVI